MHRSTSTDGRTWTKDAAPVLEAEARCEGRGLDRPRVVAALIQRNGQLTYFLEIGVATQSIGTEIYRALAPLP